MYKKEQMKINEEFLDLFEKKSSINTVINSENILNNEFSSDVILKNQKEIKSKQTKQIKQKEQKEQKEKEQENNIYNDIIIQIEHKEILRIQKMLDKIDSRIRKSKNENLVNNNI
jgi:hypothetical protein